MLIDQVLSYTYKSNDFIPRYDTQIQIYLQKPELHFNSHSLTIE